MTPYNASIDEVLGAFSSDPKRGLATAEVRERLSRFGKNELPAAKPVPAWRRFLAQFTDPLVLLLLVATAISAGLWLFERETSLPYEALAILSVVLLNAVMGYLQEARAEQAVAALRQMSAAQAHVIRDGERRTVPAAEVVPGDIIVVEEGDTAPADARLIHATALQTGEAALTGESLPVAKDTDTIEGEVGLGDRHNMIFSGTAATYGRGKAVVIATGLHTAMGQIAGALADAPSSDTPLQKELARVGKVLGGIVVAIAIVMIATIIVIEHVRGFTALFQVLMLGVALAVAAVPEGLPAVVTAVLSLGVQRMAKRNAIVRHLAAVEALGSATVIASDKTGTLTKNEMTVRVVSTASGQVRLDGTGYQPEGQLQRHGGGAIDGALRFELERALAVGDRANNAVLQEHGGRWIVQGDPTEGALIVAARKAGLKRDALRARFERIGEVPFSSDRKRMSTVHADSEEDRLLVFMKGAPDVLLASCVSEQVGETTRPLTPPRRAEIAAANTALAREALRTLAVAARTLPKTALSTDDIDEEIERELVFMGLIGMIDPPRDEARAAVTRAKLAGIRPLMITGDHPVTASVIATDLGISADGGVVTGSELSRMSDDALAARIGSVSVFARVNPDHKLRIVQALQRGGAIVAMTGDGVNDAPALKTADIGVAMGITGTDVSKEAADIVLADDNFATIVAAVEDGRSVFVNIRKFLRYLLASNTGEVMTMFFGVLLADLLGLKAAAADHAVVLPVLATQLLWINLVTDGAPALALGVDPADEGAMKQPPRPIGERVITGRMWSGILLTGATTALGALLVFDASLPGGLIGGGGSLRYAQTMTMTTLVFASLFTVFGSRSDEHTAFSGLFTNYWLWAAIGFSFVLQIAVIYLPPLQVAFSTVSLSFADWLLCISAGSLALCVRELSKLFARHSA